jgi:hypothetical protein
MDTLKWRVLCLSPFFVVSDNFPLVRTLPTESKSRAKLSGKPSCKHQRGCLELYVSFRPLTLPLSTVVFIGDLGAPEASTFTYSSCPSFTLSAFSPSKRSHALPRVLVVSRLISYLISIICVENIVS